MQIGNQEPINSNDLIFLADGAGQAGKKPIYRNKINDIWCNCLKDNL